MKKIETLIATSLVAGLALSTVACTVETTKKYTGTPVTETIDWTSGQDLQVDSRNGEVRIVVGDRDSITVLFQPFTYRASDEETEARNEMENSLVKSVVDEGDGIRVSTLKDGPGSSSLGAEIEIAIPPDFDAGLFVDQRHGGDVHMNEVGEAIQVGIEARGISDCFVHGASTVTHSKVYCGSVLLEDVAGFVHVEADFLNGNASVSMSSVEPEPDSDNIIRTEDGDIVLTLPDDEGYSVQALVASGTGQVNTGSLPSDCEEDVAAESSKTITCGSGPNFILEAGLDEVGDPVNIELRYR